MLGSVRLLYKLFVFCHPKVRHFTLDFFRIAIYGLYLLIMTSTACNLHRLLSTICIVCRTSYLYLYRPSSSYADLPNNAPGSK